MNLPGVYDTFNKLWDGYQTVWITSDLHFSDEDLRKGFPNRPSDEELVKRINAKVGRRDILIILGDCGNPEFVKQLRGYKILIAGNHEPGLSIFKDFIQEIYSGALMIGEKLLLSHEPVPNIDWALNIHGHNHNRTKVKDKFYFNVCVDVNNYEPINFNQFLKQGGYLSKINSLHRKTIDKATANRHGQKGSKITK